MYKICMLLLVFACFKLPAKTYYVAEDGQLVNKGTRESPLPFVYFELKKNHAGDIFLVADGTYANHWITGIYGIENNPVIIKSQNWLGADLVGVSEKRGNTRKILQIKGDYSWFVDFEIYESEAFNRISNSGEDFYFSSGADLFGVGSKLINCVAHDVLIGFSSWSTAVGGEIYGCIAYNIGWNNLNSSRKNKGHGHGYYVQNKAGEASFKQMTLNIVWGTASEGFHCYTQKGNIENFHFQSNLAYNLIGYNQSLLPGRGFVIGGYQPISGLKFVDNHLYKTDLQLGYGANYPIISKHITFAENQLVENNNRFYHLVDFISMQDNTFVSGDLMLIAVSAQNQVKQIWEWPLNNNHIYYPGERAPRIGIQQLSLKGTTYINYKESSWSSNGNLLKKGLPGSKVFFYQNKYDKNRALAYIYNYDGVDEFPVDLSGFLKKKQQFEVRDVENLHEVIYKGKYQEKDVMLPMELTKIATPRGNLPASHAVHSDKQFNAFLIIKK